MIWLGFYLIRHRPYFAKPGDAEQAVVYANTAARAYSTPDHGGSQQQHPPVYCADDIACPPPAYEAIFRRDTASTPHEVHVLRHRLEKLHGHRRRSSSSPADTTAACETAIRDSQIRDLAQWTGRLEMLLDDGEQDDGDAPALSRRRTVRVVQWEHEPATRPTSLGPELGSPPAVHQGLRQIQALLNA
ncbi:hypothetical protein CRV24_002591 [Beauveria bassiana]|nr:hypothetical protein CRV24_002591 [Beauveria bassiana]